MTEDYLSLEAEKFWHPPIPSIPLSTLACRHTAVCSQLSAHSASGTSYSWTGSPEGFAQLPEGIPSSSCTQLMAPVDVCKAVMEFRVPITRFLPELCSDGWSQTQLSLLKLSLRLRHGFRLCHCNSSQFQDGNSDPGKALIWLPESHLNVKCTDEDNQDLVPKESSMDLELPGFPVLESNCL